MVDDLLPGNRGGQAVAIRHIAIDQADAGRVKRADTRTLAHQAGDFVAPGRQGRHQVRPNESAAAGNQDLGHEREGIRD